MNVLFVCTQNVGRSQMAAALFNALEDDGHASAAGTKVDDEGQTLADCARSYKGAEYVIKAMHEEGTDMSHKKRHGISKDMLDAYDQIIVMAEPDTIPKYLHNHPKALYWDIASPALTGVGAIRETRDELKRKIVDLLQSE